MLTLISQIVNPVLPQNFGGTGTPTDGTALTNYILLFWRSLITLGGLAALLFFVWGAFDWVMAGGEDGKIKSARDKMTQSIIGLALLAFSVALVELFGVLLGYDLLSITFPTPTTLTPPVVPPVGP